MNPDRLLPWLGLGAILVLMTAFGLQYLGGVQPCVLCVYQRIPYIAIVLLALCQFFGLAARWVWLGMFVSFIASLGLSVYHAGVEQHWWSFACQAGSGDWMTSMPVPCDVPQMLIVGLSLTTWNVILSLCGILMLMVYTPSFDGDT